MTREPSAARRVRKLPLLIGVLGGVIPAAIWSCLSPPEHPIDRTFYFVVYTGLLGSLGLLCGYVWALARARRVRLVDALVVGLLLLSGAAFFISTKGHGSFLPLGLGAAALICMICLYARATSSRE